MKSNVELYLLIRRTMVKVDTGLFKFLKVTKEKLNEQIYENNDCL